MEEIDLVAERRLLSYEEWGERGRLENQLESIFQLKDIQWKQKVGKNWILKGDANTYFFHQYANGRRRKNTITYLEENGVEIRSQQGMVNHVVDFYKHLFGHNEDCYLKLGADFWPEHLKVAEEDKVSLIKPFEREEIKGVILEMKENSAPGPNGFGTIFFKKFWEVIRDDIEDMFKDFWGNQLDIRRLNYGVITLIPKLKEANNIRQFRPICLLNVDYKWFTKVLTNRMAPIANKIIGKNQTGFIKGRNILEGVVVLHEVLHELRRSKTQGLILKIDFEKAYDRVRWSFLEQNLIGKGFPQKWIAWVMQTVLGGQVCVNVNGERSPYFKTFRGLRQGDPLSPLLFNVVADALGIMLDKAVVKGHVKGVLGDLIPGGISHIQYADDIVIMIDGSDSSIRNLKLILYCFEWLSGLKINFHKSEVFVFGVDQKRKERMANMLNCKLGELPMKHLGIPVRDRHLNMGAFLPISQKMTKRLDPWKGRFLTSGGRQILTNTCLSSLPLYCMGFYWLQGGVHKKMDGIRAKFLWQRADAKFKYHMAKWEMA